MIANLTTLNVRNIEHAAVERIKRAAQMRDMTVGEYLAQLVDFHDAARARADAGDSNYQVELETRGLQTVQG